MNFSVNRTIPTGVNHMKYIFSSNRTPGSRFLPFSKFWIWWWATKDPMRSLKAPGGTGFFNRGRNNWSKAHMSEILFLFLIYTLLYVVSLRARDHARRRRLSVPENATCEYPPRAQSIFARTRNKPLLETLPILREEDTRMHSWLVVLCNVFFASTAKKLKQTPVSAFTCSTKKG